MSILTKVLKLFCYDPETDGANTFNIPKALNENWEKIDQLVLLAVGAAAAYDPEGSYAVGDYCTHGGKLHKCNTPIPSGEAWNAEHWTATTVAKELAEVRESLSNKANTSEVITHNALPWSSTVQDLHSAVGLLPVNPKEAGYPSINIPNAIIGFGVCLSMLYGSTRHLLMMENGNLWGQSFNGATWTDWVKFATVNSPQEYSLPLAEGITENQPCTYHKNQFNEVTIHFNGQGTITEAMLLGTLPEGFRPAKIYDIPAVYRTADGYHAGGIVLWTDGTITTHISIPSAIGCIFSASFIATR